VVAEAAQRVELAEPVADIAGDVQGLFETVRGLLRAALKPVGHAEPAQRVELTQLVAEAARGVEGEREQLDSCV
jgi:phage gp45-like